MERDTGLLHVYWGDGKGKTTAAVGLAVRQTGQNGRVVFAQFLKNGRSGELSVLKQLEGVALCCDCTASKFVAKMTPEERAEYARRCREQLRQAFDLAQTRDMLVLDEALDACELGMLEQAELLALLDGRPAGLEVVVTGHSLPQEIARRAGYITQMQSQRHPYDRGIKARRGVEY